MSPQEIQLVRRSFAQLIPIADQAAALFYARLFERDPALRALFHGDMAAQGKKLMEAIGFCVASLERIETIVPMVRAMGLNHADYQVKESHYESVGAALLWTLEKGLGAEFTPEMRTAWSKVYWLLAEIMKAGARDGATQRERIA